MQETCRGNKETGEGSKRKPVRRDPERRRQQNLRAQKKHRDKVKERLAHLEALHGLAAMQGPAGAKDVANLDALPHQSAAFPAAGGPDASASVGQPARPGERREEEEDIMTLSSAPDAWDPMVHVDPFLVHRQRQRGRDDDDDDDGSSTALACTTPLSCSCAHPHAALVQTGAHGGRAPETLVRLGLVPPPSHRSHHYPRRGSVVVPADPYANHLRVEALCTIAALQAAGQPLGVPAWQACARGTESAFARPGATTRTTAAWARLFASLPRDLRPGAAQLRCRHRPVIDALPFPTLRRNLILPPPPPFAAVDIDAFLLDALVGLVCWSGAGDGGGGAPRPWEARAWEARAWFLQKYWLLLGGEAGELVRQSAWWRAARGEVAYVGGV